MEKQSLKDLRKEVSEEYEDSDLSSATIKTILDWSCSGKSEKEIAKLLSMSKKEFEQMKAKYPEVVGIMAKGQAYANSQLALSMYQLAIGGSVLCKQTITHKTIYNEYGKKVADEPVVMTIKEQLAPNFYALKYLLDAKEPVAFGVAKREEKESENEQVLKGANLKDLTELDAFIKKSDIDAINGKKN